MHAMHIYRILTPHTSRGFLSPKFQLKASLNSGVVRDPFVARLRIR